MPNMTNQQKLDAIVEQKRQYNKDYAEELSGMNVEVDIGLDTDDNGDIKSAVIRMIYSKSGRPVPGYDRQVKF